MMLRNTRRGARARGTIWDMVQGAPPALGAGVAEFDSRVPDCDAREQVNPARRERVLDGIVTRASPHYEMPRDATGVAARLSIE